MNGSHRYWIFLVGLVTATLARPTAAQSPTRIGVDHIPVAVVDLERAAATYRALGFALKPGRPHANGLRNTHVKFPDGAGLELLTVPHAVDALSTHYVTLLRAGEGPAFVSFHARNTEHLHAALRDGGYAFRHDGGLTELEAPEFASLFFLRDNRSPTDQPEHFAHANGATALRAVWIATEHDDVLARLLVQLGGREQRRQVFVPDPAEATVVTLAEGEVIILPAQHQVIAGRPVIGASFRVPDLARVRHLLSQARLEPWAGAGPAERVVVGPPLTHGLWLEFRASP